jgi:hypothetical protein
MKASDSDDRHVRAAVNQALFRAANERTRELNQTFATVTDTFWITCECADTGCIEPIEIHPHEYLAVRVEPRHFAVLRGHVYPDVEIVVRTTDAFVVVEKIALAAEIAERMAAGDGPDDALPARVATGLPKSS